MRPSESLRSGGPEGDEFLNLRTASDGLPPGNRDRQGHPIVCPGKSPKIPNNVKADPFSVFEPLSFRPSS